MLQKSHSFNDMYTQKLVHLFQTGQGTIHKLRKHSFLAFFEPPTYPCKHISSIKSRENLTFSEPPTYPYVLM